MLKENGESYQAFYRQVQTDIKDSNMKQLLFFLAVVVVGGIAIGSITAPGTWHAELVKPSFSPPNWIFGPVWSLLYALIAIAGWRAWKLDPGGRAMKI